MTFWRKKRTYALILVIFIGVLFLTTPLISKLVYPFHYEEHIRRHAATYNLDPYLVAAIIRVESNYQTEIESHKGAYGLMQLMPDTSNWIIDVGKFPPGYRELLHDPSVSIELGAWYLSWLSRQFDGNMTAAIAGYNAGQGNVQKWMADGRWDGSLEQASQVPFGETRHYIQRVYYYHEIYSDLYGDKLTEGSNKP